MSNPAYSSLNAVWVKAHQNLEGPFETHELFLTAKGNMLADEWAKKGANLHTEPLVASMNRGVGEVDALQSVFRLAVAVAKQDFADPTFKMSRREWQERTKLLRAARPPRAPRVPRPRLLPPLPGHRWFWGSRSWSCLICGLSARSDRSKRRHDHSGCLGSNPMIEGLIRDPKRHLLYGFIMEGRSSALLSCRLCGAWTTKKPVRLANLCTRAFTIASSRESSKIWKDQRHPLEADVLSSKPIPISSLEGGRVQGWLQGRATGICHTGSFLD